MNCQCEQIGLSGLHGPAKEYTLFGDKIWLCDFCYNMISKSSPEEHDRYYKQSVIGMTRQPRIRRHENETNAIPGRWDSAN